MKTASVQKLGLQVLFLLFCCAALPAQGQHRITIVKKSAVENGAAPKAIDEVALLDLMNGKNTATVINLNDTDVKYYMDRYSDERDPCKVFIGVETSEVSGGLKVDYTIDNTPATTYGVQAGDVILALDGIQVGTQSELIRERDKHQQGDPFTLTILRDGREMNIDARFKACSDEEKQQFQQQQEERKMRHEALLEQMKSLHDWNVQSPEGFMKMEMKERPILGVYEEEGADVEGLAIRTVIEGKGAEAAGLKAGDVITGVDGKTVRGTGSLRAALDGHKPGDRVTVVYLRDGRTQQTGVTLSADRSFYSYTATVERDPCAVFIGVYTGDVSVEAQGVRVTGIVDNTPASESGIQPGDIILSLDGQPVNSHEELLRERNKHQPGDAFRLAVLRDGSEMSVDARFKVCPNTANGLTPVKELVKVTPEEKPAEQRNNPANTETELLLPWLELYPNPTAGPLNIRFEAEAVPTTVRIIDAGGKTVYANELSQFSGYFSEQINLNGTPAGTYILTIQQGKKLTSRKIVLMPRV